MPDGGSARDATHIDHRRIIIVPGPDTHHEISGIAHRPVIAEIIGRPRFGGGRSHHAPVAIPTIPLRIRVKLQHIAIEKFGDAVLIIAQHIGHHIGQLRTDNLGARRELMLEENLPCGTHHNLSDGIIRHVNPAIGKCPHRRGMIDQANPQTAQHHRETRRPLIRRDTHILSCLQGISDTHMIEYQHPRYIERVLQCAAQRHMPVKVQIIV